MISLVVIAVFFLLLEVEAALLLRKLVTINRTRKTVRIRLSASKTDPMALSVTREWGCVCPPDGSAAGSHYSSVPPCPYCAAVTQSEIVSAVAREKEWTWKTPRSFRPHQVMQLIKIREPPR